MDNFKKAYDLLKAWKGDSYICGLGCLEEIGNVAKKYAGEDGSVLVVSNTTYMKPVADRVVAAIEKAGVKIAGGTICPNAKPNAPREDVYRITTYVLQHKPSAIVAIGGGQPSMHVRPLQSLQLSVDT